MLSQRFINPTSAERWSGKEDRDPGFNIMSPVGRNRPSKRFAIPSKKMNMVWDRHPQSSGMSGYSSHNNYYHDRDQAYKQEWGLSEALFHPSEPHDVNGVSYVYNRGPAGQTPFPTLIAMSGYFPSSQQPVPMQSQQAHMPPPPSLYQHTHQNSTVSNIDHPQPQQTMQQQQQQQQQQH